MNSTRTRFVTFSLLAVLATVASMLFIDKQLALAIWRATSSQPFLQKHIKEIPNILPKLVAFGTATMWLAYYAASRKNVLTTRKRFFRLAATAIPIAFLVKLFLHHAFGRTNIRLWLRAGEAVKFRWFDPLEGGGFPSGHIIVFTAFFTAVWMYYPKYRSVVIAAMVVLVVALLLTSYHFVSDIIGGIYVGILVTAVINHFLPGPPVPES